MYVEVEYFKSFVEISVMSKELEGGHVVGIFTKAQYGKRYAHKARGFAHFVARQHGLGVRTAG